MCTQAGPAGIPADSLKGQLSKYAAFQQAMQTLLYSARKLIIPVSKNGVIYYKIAASSTGQMSGSKAAKLNQMSELERRVYEAVKAEDTKGLWSRDLKQQLQQYGKGFIKAVKKLEKDQLIKTVKSVANRTRTMYMLYELDPHESVTGGTWFNEQQFDREFVNVIYRTVFQVVKDNDQASLETIERQVASLEVSRKPLSLEDIQAIVNTLIYDGKLIEVVSDVGSKYYQLATSLVDWNAFAEIPCASCVLEKQCDPEGGEPYNPQSCPYLAAWLE